MDRQEQQKTAWIYREEGQPSKALAINYGLLYECEADEDWLEAIDIVVDISLAWSVLGRETEEHLYFKAAHDTIEYAKKLSEIHSVPLREDYNFHLGRVLEDVGKYSEAVEALESYLELEKANLTSDRIAEIEARLGHILVMNGEKDRGTKLLRNSVRTLEQEPEVISTQGKDLTAIKRTGAKIKLASVLDNKNEARQILQEVIEESKSKGLGARLNETTRLLKKLG